MIISFKSEDGRYEVSAHPVVVASIGPPPQALDEPRWSELPADMLVPLAGLSGQVATAGGWTLPHPYGFGAQAELSRRLTVQLEGFRADAAASARASEVLSTEVTKLTRRLLFLTWVLVGVGFATIITTIAVAG